MEKIIYNTKLKKIFVSIILIMLLFNFIMPTIVNAAVDDSYWQDITWITPKAEWKEVFLKDMTEKLYDEVKYSESEMEFYAKQLAGAKADEKVPLGQLNDSTGQWSYWYQVEYQAYKAAFEEFNSGIDQALSDGNDLYSAVEIASRQAGDAAEEVEDDYTADPSETADLGGILLSPIFYLINFIADAITSNLGRIMMQDSISLTSGTQVLVAFKDSDEDNVHDNTNEYNTTSYSTYEVNLSSFLPNLLSTDSYQVPNIKYTPEEIFAGKIDLLSIDFISGKNADGEEITGDWTSIRTVIAQWYQILRMIAIIGLLSVLIYTGIKIIISANAKDKAKYKEWIINWFMAVAILFAMQFIMAFIISVTGEFSNLISDSFQSIKVELSDGYSFYTNLMGLVRFMIQSEDFYKKVGFEVMYIALIVYTIKFTIVYLKRVLNMAFLTLIAPIVALTYPIDKINDGKAQGFDMWLKEYIFNALLQPMHQLMYYILVGSAVSIAASNPIYGIVVLAFMTEAERLLKRIFGFDKAGGGTVGGMANAFAAGAVASSISKMMKLPKGNAGKGADGLPKNDMYDNPKPIAKGANDDDVFDNTSRESAVPKMADAYDEKFGTDEYDSAERESMQREVNKPEGRALQDEELRNELINNQGMSEEEAAETIAARQGKNDSENSTVPENLPETRPNITPEQVPEVQNKASTTRIQKMAAQANQKLNAAKNSRQMKGLANVGKRMLKPVWDLDHTGKDGVKYNAKRLVRKVGRAAVGTTLGVAAAAVQAGISITDGKYNPAEGAASFAAGYAGGGKIASGWESLKDTYKEGRDAGDKEAIMKQAQERWSQRDDVIKYNKKYKKEEIPDVLRVQKELLSQGVTDTKEMDRCIKYMKEINGGSLSGISSNDIKKSRVLHDFDTELAGHGMQKAPYDADMRKKYIDSMTKGLSGNEKASREKIINKKFDELIKYRDANKP